MISHRASNEVWGGADSSGRRKWEQSDDERKFTSTWWIASRTYMRTTTMSGTISCSRYVADEER